MGQKGLETRARLLDATLDLVEAGGYSGAGLNQVIAASGAPRGSLYFHFPGGKDQLVGEALAAAGHEVDGIVGELATGALGYVRREGESPRPSDWPVPIEDPAGQGPLIWIVPVPEPKTVKNRMHLDVTGDKAELLSLGATLVRARDQDIEWDILADPEGNEFCVFAPRP